mmetsp:Transcript_1363/g.5343  ORF Transcript_1363/g.5343 Transcript_1363/m.5343 type:complete len:1954 (+) Transcript_1363:238-6099(+)
MVHWGGQFDRAGGGDDDIVSIAPSTSTLAGDDDARVGARRHHDSPPRDLSRHHQIPPSTSRSHRSGLSDGGSTRPFRASVSAPARTWRTRALSLIVESDGATSEWVLRVDPSQLSSPDERGDSVGSTLVFGGFDATRLRVRAGPSRAPRDADPNAVNAGDPTGDADPGVRWVSLTRMGGGSEEIPTFFYRVDDDDDDAAAADDDAVTMSFAVADAMGSFGSPVGATTISSASVAASTADPSRLASASQVEDESGSPDESYRISPWMPGSAASSLRDPTPRVHRPTDVSNVSTNETRTGPTPGPMDDTPRRLTFADGDDSCDAGGRTESPPSEGTALLAAVMAEVSTPSRFTGVTNLTHRLGLGPVGAIAAAATPSSVRQATNGEVFSEDVESSFEKSFDGGYGGEDVEAAIDAGEQVLTPTLARAMRRVVAASPYSASTCSSTSASTSASARVPLLDAWRTERTTSAAFRVWRMSAVLTNQERERATLIRLRNEAIAAGIPPSPIATLRADESASEAPWSPAPSSAHSRQDTFSVGQEKAAAFTPGVSSLAREGPDATAASSASAATQTPASVTSSYDAEDATEDTEDAAEAARFAEKLRRLGENVLSIRASARLEEIDAMAIRRRERETRLVASSRAKTDRRIAGATLRAWWATAFREVTARRLAAAARIAADCHVLAAEGAARADAFIAHAHNRAVRAVNARSVTRAFETWANEAAKTASLRRRLAWGKVSTDWREKRSSFARWVRFVDDSIALNDARLVAVTRILTRVFARAMREGFTAWKTRSEDVRRARRNAIVAFARFAARTEASFGREVTQAWRTHVMEGISRRRAVMTRLDTEDRTARNAFRLCARSELRRRRDRIRRWRTFASVCRLKRRLFASALSNVRREWDESVANARRAALGAWRVVAARASRRRRSAERVEWAVDLCVQSATRNSRLGGRRTRCWRDDYRSVVSDVVAGWKLAVASAHAASKLVDQAAAAMARHRTRRVKRECYDEWLVVAVRAAGWREKSAAAAARRTRRRTRAVFNAWRADAVSVVRAFATLRSLARVERARRGFLDASDSFRGWRRVTSEAASSRFSAASTARAARRFAKDSASRRLRRVVRMWYAIAGAAVAHPERRRAHDVAVAAHRRSSNLKTTARAFAALRVAVVKRAVTAVTADATRVKCAAVAGWRARRVRREVFWALVRAAERGARFRDALAAVARQRLVASGKTFLRRWRSVARDATEARRADDVLETMRTRSERRDAWRRLATWRRAVYASRTLTNREARADRFYSRRLRAQYLARSLSAWIRFARARTAQRVLNERALMSAARLRARIERSTTRGVLEAWLGVTKALRRLASDVAAFAERRNARTLSAVVVTWRWRAAASTEARELAANLVRRAGVRCVRAWRKHCVDKSAESRSLRRRYARVVTRRMARRLRQWRINAVDAIAARGSIAAANARVMERALNERYERYVFHAWRWHVAWSNGYAEAISEANTLRRRDASRAVFCGWRLFTSEARRLAACERRVATRRVRRTALECVWALAIHASRSRRLRSFAARCGRAPSAASAMTPTQLVRRAFAEWQSLAVTAAADREREALVARGATARARRSKLPPCVREWRRVAREALKAAAAAETRFGAKTEALKFRAFRAFIASVYRAKDAASARERELTRAMEVRSRAREVLAEAEMIANRTSVEFDPVCAEPAEVDAMDEVDAVDRVAAAAGIAALPAPPPPSSHPLLHPPVVAPAATIESIDESAIFDLSADEQDVSIADDDDKNLTPPDAPNEKESKAEAAAAVVAVAPSPSAHSREYDVAYKAAYDAALAAAEAEAAALRARLAETRSIDASRPATNRYEGVTTNHLHVLDDKENAGGGENDAGKRRTGGQSSSHSTYAKVYHDGGTARVHPGGTSDAMLGPVRGARTAKALRAADAILGRHERNDGYGHGSAEAYSRVYHHR